MSCPILKLWLACRVGDLSLARATVHAGVDVHSDGEFAFRVACASGQLVMAQWLVTLGGVDIHAVNDGAFAWACTHGHLPVVRWLLGLDPWYARWPAECVALVKGWSRNRNGWMCSVVTLV